MSARSEEFEFGKEHGLVHEAVVTGRKVGADRAFWSSLAHDQELFARVVRFVSNGAILTDPLVGLFVSPTQQLENVRRWNEEYKLGFTDEDFERLGPPPITGNEFVQPVLVPYGDTVKSTFELLWKITVAQQPGQYRWSEVKSDLKHLRYLEGIHHNRKCLRWERIDLAAHWDKKDGIRPKDVRDPKTSPHAGILAAAAHFPKWVQAMDGETVPYVWLPGYELNVPDYGEWTNVPTLLWDADSCQVELNANYADYLNGNWAVPSLRE